MPRDPTLEFYDSRPRDYAEGTFRSDMSPSIRRFVQYVPEGGRILDLGCGSGRDSLTFLRLGYDVLPADGSEGMRREAERLTGLKA